MKRTDWLIPGVLFLTCIVAANYATTHYGMVTILGEQATAGTYFAGLTFILRDLIQDRGGRWVVVGLIVLGAGLSYLVADDARIALASGVAFLLSELCDFGIYTPLREGGYLRAAVASNVVGAFVDTVVFLWIAGFPVWSSVPGQMYGKLAMTLIVAVLVVGVRTTRRVRV